MPNHLHTTLDRLGIPKQPRYPMNTTAEILGVSRDQVADLLRLGRLNGTRSSERRWAGVWHAELETYMERIHEHPNDRLPVVHTPKPPRPEPAGQFPVSMKDQLQVEESEEYEEWSRRVSTDPEPIEELGIPWEPTSTNPSDIDLDC